jgi:anti-sigma factor ChrR (cupin superfamily)
MKDAEPSGPPDLLVNTDTLPWLPLGERASFRLLRVSPETGVTVMMLRVEAGGCFAAHKHLGAAEGYVTRGSFKYRTGVARAGDYFYEANGAVHEATHAEEDSESLFILHGPIALLAEDGSYEVVLDWEYYVSVARGGEFRDVTVRRSAA